jgi:hypothetical protein
MQNTSSFNWIGIGSSGPIHDDATPISSGVLPLCRATKETLPASAPCLAPFENSSASPRGAGAASPASPVPGTFREWRCLSASAASAQCRHHETKKVAFAPAPLAPPSFNRIGFGSSERSTAMPSQSAQECHPNATQLSALQTKRNEFSCTYLLRTSA